MAGVAAFPSGCIVPPMGTRVPDAEGRESPTSAPGGGGTLERFFAETQARAFSLAFRITGERGLAEQATAAAYQDLPAPYDEARLLENVRTSALALAPRRSTIAAGSYPVSEAVRTAFDSLEHLQRSSLELAHSGGMNVKEIASVLERDPEQIRVALREALLKLGAAAREGQSV